MASKHWQGRGALKKKKRNPGLSIKTPKSHTLGVKTKKPYIGSKDKIAMDNLYPSLKPSLNEVRTDKRKINSL